GGQHDDERIEAQHQADDDHGHAEQRQVVHDRALPARPTRSHPRSVAYSVSTTLVAAPRSRPALTRGCFTSRNARAGPSPMLRDAAPIGAAPQHKEYLA